MLPTQSIATNGVWPIKIVQGVVVVATTTTWKAKENKKPTNQGVGDECDRIVLSLSFSRSRLAGSIPGRFSSRMLDPLAKLRCKAALAIPLVTTVVAVSRNRTSIYSRRWKAYHETKERKKRL